MFNNLRYQLLSAFSFFSLLIISLIVINYIYITQKKQVEKIQSAVNSLNIKITDHSNTLNNFFIYDTKDPDFYINGISKNLIRQKEKLSSIKSDVYKLNELKGFKQFNGIINTSNINKEINTYESYINEIVTLIKKRGYKDFGAEGRMRNYIHQLEDIESVDLSKVLMLRRHEKDYIIRNEEKYIHKLLSLSDHFITEIKHNKSLSYKNQKDAVFYLENYVSIFNKLVKLDKRIGIKDNSGLTKNIFEQGNKLNSIFKYIVDATKTKTDKYFNKLKFYYTIFLVLIILFSIFLSLYLSKKITSNISILSANISQFVNSNFNEFSGDTFPTNYKNDEVGRLIDHYKILRNQILTHINDLQGLVEKRTKAISCQKERIAQQKEEIESQRDEVFEQNKLIHSQKEKVEQQNKDIISSIQYAQRIQLALMPSLEKINSYFNNNFVLYKPKDIISGDFFWTKKIENENYNITIVAVADCTGHGVPGALMSMLGIAFLNEIVLKKEVKTANQILDKLRDKVIESLQSQSNGMVTNDGMDIGLALIDHNTNELHFTGANRPLYLVRNKTLTVLNGDKMPIGKHGFIDSIIPFSNHTFNITPGDSIYLFSDGYADQFGGPKNKKYKRQRLKELILGIQDHTMLDQKEILETEHKKWRNTNRQTDDILILGIKF